MAASLKGQSPAARSSRLWFRVLSTLLVPLGVHAGALASEVDNRLRECERLLASAPRGPEGAGCFLEVAESDGMQEEAARRLAALLPRYRQNHWLELNLAHIEWYRKPERAVDLYGVAARGFAQQRDAAGEVRARYNLRNLLFERGRFQEAEAELNRALGVARSSGQPELVGQALILQAIHLRQRGEDLGRVYRALREAEPLLFPSGAYSFRRAVLRELAGVCLMMGRPREARAYYRRYEALTGEARDDSGLASAKLGIAITLLMELEELPQAEGSAEVIRFLEAALQLSSSPANLRNRILAHELLGDVLGNVDPVGARRHLEQCLEGARASGNQEKIGDCLWSLGAFLARRDPKRAHKLIAEALSLAVESENKLFVADASRQRMRVSWKTGPREKAIEHSLQALDTIEALRGLQHDTEGRTGLFSAWTRDYYLALGRVLDRADGPPDEQDIGLAFSIAERMRARVLLERLSAATQAPARAEGNPREGRRREILEAIVDAHRRLLHPALVGAQRSKALAELERLELEEAGLRAEIARDARPHSEPRMATLDEVESGLGPDEALLSFQIALWEDVYGDFGGGSWLTVSTRGRTRVFRLPDRVTLEPAIPVFLGLFERRDGSEARAAATLYQEVLQEGLASLPPEVTKLIIVADGGLHRLPFAALRRRTEGEPLVARYQLSVVPSATLWLHWRRGSLATTELAGLAMADPEPLRGGESIEASEERAWLIAEGARLGPLPYARREGRAVVRHLGGASRLLVGAKASEHYLKHADLRKVGVLHLAAHALVDEENPERGAVLLAPGADSEDGFLQVREITEMRLDGQLVVLSACQTASGAVLRGEGVLSLARAFFQAGARAVIGSLWPLRDDEAAILFDAFYRHLATGASVTAALNQAQRDGIRAGLPSSAWAGLVVLGDGEMSFAAKAPPGWSSWALLVALLLGASAVVGVLRHRRAATRRHAESPRA